MSATSRVHAWWIQLVAVTLCFLVKSCKHWPRVVIRGARRVSLTWALLLQAEDKLQQCRHVVLCRWFPRLSCCRTLNCFPSFSSVFQPFFIACVFLLFRRSSASSSSWLTATTFVVCLARQFRRDIAEFIQFCTFLGIMSWSG